MNINQQRTPFHVLTFILFVVAVFFLLLLLSTVEKDVFFSGDAGLKYLVTKQITNGGSNIYLELNSPSWVSKIWSQGFYPFKTPFVYDTPNGKLVSFPPAFQWLSSLMYRSFGYKGLYMIPIMSVLALWYWFLVLMKRKGVRPQIISIAFTVLAFASPLTIYGAIYWEHTFAMLLFFAAISFVFSPDVTTTKAAVLGLIAGTSVWFRPEMLVLCFLFSLAVLYNQIKIKQKANLVFLIALYTGILSFFIFNSYLYSDILGAHSYQLSIAESSRNYFYEKIITLSHLNGRLVLFFPAVIIFCIVAVCMLFKKKVFTRVQKLLTVIVVLFLLITPFALPNAGGKQWGPRYFLPVIPLVITLFCIEENYARVFIRKKWLWIVSIVLISYGVYLNVFKAYFTLRDDYAYRVKPGIDFLRQEDCEVVVVQNQFISQEFAILFDRKKIFLAEDQQSFDRLKDLLQAASVTKIIFVSHNADFERMPVNLLSKKRDLKKIGNYYFAAYDLLKGR